jgi:hypothetical protein
MGSLTATTWVDYVVAIGTLLASMGALAAVGLTLYLNIWRDKSRRPSLSVELPEEAFHGVAFGPLEDDGPVILSPVAVKNGVGKNSAHRVEVLLSAGYWLGSPATQSRDKRFVEIINQDPLTWWISDPPQGSGQPSAEIPPGVTRKAVLLICGHPRSIFDLLPPHKPLDESDAGYLERQLGMFPVVPLTQNTTIWVDNHLAYELRLTVVGEDLDAISYRTRLRWGGVTYEELQQADDAVLVYPNWEPLEPIDPDDWPGSPAEDNRGWI